MQTILVLCTGNSCRSIMAEALINHLGQGKYTAVSAGSNPVGQVHPQTLQTLARHAVPYGEPRSKSWDEFAGQSFDLVITVCDQAASESCPILFGHHKKLHWSTPDPGKATGTEEDIHQAFERALLHLKRQIEKELL